VKGLIFASGISLWLCAILPLKILILSSAKHVLKAIAITDTCDVEYALISPETVVNGGDLEL
jgi:hypothetical protein